GKVQQLITGPHGEPLRSAEVPMHRADAVHGRAERDRTAHGEGRRPQLVDLDRVIDWPGHADVYRGADAAVEPDVGGLVVGEREEHQHDLVLTDIGPWRHGDPDADLLRGAGHQGEAFGADPD